MPEEQNRRLTDHLSTWLFCPTQVAIDNLLREGIANNQSDALPSADNKCVEITGDIMYDASLYYRDKSQAKAVEYDFILLTIHRAENTDDTERLIAICNALNKLSDFQFIFPVHPRTRKIIEQNNIHLASHIKLIEPVGYFEMLSLESSCIAVLTDSGGVQKEAYFFKKPCITLRDSTEWVELVTAGWNTLTGANTEKIVNTVRNLHIPREYPALYGDGTCAHKICDFLIKRN